MTASVTGSFASATAGAWVKFRHGFNVSVWGTFSAAVVLERSFDGGTTALPYTYSNGTPLSWSAPFSTPFEEPEPEVWYRLRCSNYISGTVSWRLSQ